MCKQMQVLFARIEEINELVAKLLKQQQPLLEYANSQLKQGNHVPNMMTVVIERIDRQIDELEKERDSLQKDFMKRADSLPDIRSKKK